jgi:hypothetical protein
MASPRRKLIDALGWKDALREELANIDAEHAKGPPEGTEPQDWDRVHSTRALAITLRYQLEAQILSNSLQRIFSELDKLEHGGRSMMLSPKHISHRPTDSEAVQFAKGATAAFATYQQAVRKQPRKKACEWVSRHMSPAARAALGGGAPATIGQWLQACSGEFATDGKGRDAYAFTLHYLDSKDWTDQELVEQLASIGSNFPTPENR